METHRRLLVPAHVGKPRIRKNPGAAHSWAWSCVVVDKREREWIGNGRSPTAAYDQLAAQIRNLDRMGLLWEVFP